MSPAATASGEELRRRYPALSTLLTDRWLNEQARAPVSGRGPLFGWLLPGQSSPFLDELHLNVVALDGVAGVAERTRRLRGRLPDFWAALCELKMAAALVASGMTPTLHPDTPDIRAYGTAGMVGIELTARFPTLRFSDLHAALVEVWGKNGRLILLCPDETVHFLATQRDALLEVVANVDYDALDEIVPPEEDMLDKDEYLYRDVVFELDERRVPTSEIVDPEQLELFLGPAPVPAVIVRSGVRFGFTDPWPEIVGAAALKARRMPASEVAIVAFEGGFLAWGAWIWAERVAAAAVVPELHLPENIAGVLCYWQDATRSVPVKTIDVPNRDFGGAPAAVEAVLGALGVRGP